jgi:XTP/dITP diphosphohydrolase
MILVTHNQHKFLEYEEIFLRSKIELEWYNYEYPELQSDNLKEIVEFSLKHVSRILNRPFFLEDTGLFIDSLGGFPGPYSSYVQEKIGNMGILRLLEGISNRNARFISLIGYFDGKNFYYFDGTLEGSISYSIRGKSGFGYDPIFIPEKYDKTLAEMSIQEKNSISHRRRALDKLLGYIKNSMESIK